jgi:hypothetical protein
VRLPTEEPQFRIVAMACRSAKVDRGLVCQLFSREYLNPI